MRRFNPPVRSMVAARENANAIFVALELSRSNWLIAISLPHSEKVSKYRIAAADTVALLSLLSRLKMQAEQRCGETVRVVSIHEAGLDGFWVHRLLQANGIDSQVVDAASIAVERRKRRAKTDRIDVEKLLRTLMGWARGERRVCSMVRPPTPRLEDARRLTRERETLIAERIKHVNRIKGLLATQGIFEFEPLRKHRQLDARFDRRFRLLGVRDAADADGDEPGCHHQRDQDCYCEVSPTQPFCEPAQRGDAAASRRDHHDSRIPAKRHEGAGSVGHYFAS